MLSMALKGDAKSGRPRAEVQMPLLPASPATDTSISSCPECHRSYATCMRHCSPACPVSSGEAKAAAVMVMLYVAMHCEAASTNKMQMSNPSWRPSHASFMHYDGGATSVCQAQEPFTLAGLQEAYATKTGCFFSLQSRKSTRKYPHAWQVIGRSLPEFTLQASDLLQTANSSFSGGGTFWQSRLRPAA